MYHEVVMIDLREAPKRARRDWIPALNSASTWIPLLV